MPVERRRAKGRVHRIAPEAIEAFRAGDYLALHAALDLRPWEVSPLPLEVEGLGCDQGPLPSWAKPGHAVFDTWEQAQELQQLLQEAAR